ncbi:hypothetical protein [Methylobacterium sp. AMS5]|uniref:hypothetical protein n=1 Tax=Methylobacterium sp. AMS5 TaxID=925818 RepID=UPI00074F92D1|nr:hypothetical protein [Methylobacterium sp. AMS5]AMB48363.1 hypothetical protein Y590_25680 [Methylobacterium sp. AMS5]
MASSKKTFVTLLEKVKKGNRLYGGIYQYPNGERVYLAYRSRKEIYRSGEACISDAVRSGTACWAIDDGTLIQMRARCIKFVGVKLKDDDKGYYLTRIENFFDRDKAKVLNYTGRGRGGSLQRFLPLDHFLHKPGVLKL